MAASLQTLSRKIAKIPESVIFNKNVDGTVSVMRLSDHDCFVIHGIAAQVWSSIDGKSTIGAICKKVQKKNKVGESPFNAKSAEFFQTLRENGLIVWK